VSASPVQPFSFRLIQIFTCFEAVFHGRQNSADRATASGAPARSELLRQMIEEFRRHIASILSWWLAASRETSTRFTKRFAAVPWPQMQHVRWHFLAFGGRERKGGHASHGTNEMLRGSQKATVPRYRHGNYHEPGTCARQAKATRIRKADVRNRVR